MYLSLLLLSTLLRVATSARVPNSPLPTPSRGLNASTLLFYLSQDGLSPSDELTLATLQGALTRLGAPRIYRAASGSDYADLWAPGLSDVWQVSLDNTTFAGVWDAVAFFNRSVTTYVIANTSDGSVNAAVALCSAYVAIAITADNEARAIAAGLGRLADVRGRDLAWVLANVGTDKFSSRVTLIQSPSKTGMSDWAIAGNALPWYVPDATTGLATQIWDAMTPPFFALGWGPDERGTVSSASSAGGGVIATDWAQNLDALSAFDVPGLSQKPTFEPPRARSGTHTAAFLMSDGDNVQWLLGGFARSSNFYASPDRGRVPMGWTISPSLVDLAPVAMKYFYDNAADGVTSSCRDVFVAGLSGAAYSYVDLDDAGRGFSEKINLTLAYAAKAGLEYQNVMTNGDTLALNIATAYLAPPSPLAGLFHYSYDDYALGGAITFIGDKPVIQARFNLWGDGTMGKNFLNVQQAAAALVKAGRDPTVADGYSLIVVHAWTHNVSDAREVMDIVNSQTAGVNFVAPDELAALVAANVKR